jgi:ubiquinone/menaquinone biosynthesis C-methylase UbiE
MTPIDFHAQSNRFTYTGRDASAGWRDAIVEVRDPSGLRVIDIGCGGGIYARALIEMGAASVIGVDISEAMLVTAREACAGISGLSFVQGEADAVPLPDGSADLILARGLIHHLPELDGFARELRRLMAPGGTAIIQDRTPVDVAQPAGPENVRGYFFECHPKLRQYDATRRYSDEAVRSVLLAAGFPSVNARSIDEARAVHPNMDAQAEQLRARSGRSILHELTDPELEELIDYIRARVPTTGEIVEKDHWTLWSATDDLN